MEYILLEDGLKKELKEINEDIKAKQAGTYKEKGLSSGIGMERLVPGGIPLGLLTVLCGDTGVGKSITLASILDAISKSGEWAVNFSLEDSQELIFQRALSRLSGVHFKKILMRDLSRDELRRISDIKTEAIECVRRIIVCDVAGVSIDEVLREVDKFIVSHNIKCAAVDYIQVLEDVIENEKIGLKRVVLKQQTHARRSGIAHIALSQLNREGLKREGDQRPRKYDLYGASAIEQCSKLIIGVHRPSKHGEPIKGRHYDFDNEKPCEEVWDKRIEAWVLKNVRGPSDVYVELQCDFETGAITVE
jgi:replicative DNA helicase